MEAEVPVAATIALAVVPIVLGWVFSRNKSTAEAANQITSAAAALSAAQQRRIDALEAQVAGLQQLESDCKARLAAIQAELDDLRATIARPPTARTRKTDEENP